MNTLFPLETGFPPGFFYYPDFINVAEEQELCDEISRMSLHNMQFHGYEAKRKVASFGYDYSFENRSLSKGKDIPAAFGYIVQKTANHISIDPAHFAELLITEYPETSVINWHRDAPPFGLIAGISLLSDCTFKLRPHDKSKQNRKSTRSLQVRRRSLYLLSGESRTEWEHSIAPVISKRYSITLRTLKE